MCIILRLIFNSSLFFNGDPVQPCSEDGEATIEKVIVIISKGHKPEADQALEWLSIAARNNNIEAQYQLGKYYSQAEGLEQNDVNALKWLRLAASKNHGKAQWLLALYLKDGRGIEKNLNLAVDYILKSAETGNCNAQVFLGKAYRDGYEGVILKDMGKSYQWFLKAALQGDSWAQFWVGVDYNQGKGVQANIVESKKWLSKSVEHGDYTDPFMTPAHKNRFTQLVAAANNGNSQSQLELALAYRDGVGVPSDWREYEKYLAKASEANNRDACFILGKSLIHSERETGLKLLKKAADLGNDSANLEYFRWSEMKPVDRIKLINEFEKKLENGDPETQYYLSRNFNQGSEERRKWVLKSAEKGYLQAVRESQSFELFKKFADRGDVISQCELGYLYKKNNDIISSLKYTQLAAKGGSQCAQYCLASQTNQFYPKLSIEERRLITSHWARVAICSEMGVFSSIKDTSLDLKELEKLIIESGN